jgi:MFS family permease
MGVAIATYQTSVTTLVQKVTTPAMLGRAMTLLTLGWFGTTPVGALIAGWVADTWSARAAMGMAGSVSLICAAFLLWASWGKDS